MLERLAEVPWDELETYCGPAGWMPGAIRDLLDPDPEVWSDAFGRFEQGIDVLGDVTPRVVPFMIELAASPATPGRGRLMRWLAMVIEVDGLNWAFSQGVSCRALNTIELGCLAAVWDGVGEFVRLLDDPESDVRIASACVLSLMVNRADAVGRAGELTGVAEGLRARLAGEAEPVARAGHAFALGNVAARLPVVRAWLREIERAADLGDPTGLACASRLVDLGEPFDGTEAARFVERLLRFDLLTLGPDAVHGLPWWSSLDTADTFKDYICMEDIEEFLTRRFDRLSERHPELVGMVERRAVDGRGIERANALWLAYPSSGARRRGWPAVEPGPGEDLAGSLILATVALRGDALEVFRWAIPHVIEAFGHPDPALRRRASWFLSEFKATGLGSRVPEFAEAIRGERDPAVLADLAGVLCCIHRRTAPLSLELLRGWLDAPDGPRDPADRRPLWRAMATLARAAPSEETSAWLRRWIDDPDRAGALDVFGGLRAPG